MEPSLVFNYLSVNRLPLEYTVDGISISIKVNGWDIQEIDDMIFEFGGTRIGFTVKIPLEVLDEGIRVRH